jgi:hypothetical protein
MRGLDARPRRGLRRPNRRRPWFSRESAAVEPGKTVKSSVNDTLCGQGFVLRDESC